MTRIENKSQYIFEYTDYLNLKTNLKKYAEIFSSFGLLCIRNAFFDDEKCLEILTIMSENFEWTPIPYSDDDGISSHSWKYTQNYDERILNSEYHVSKKNLINSWHVEGVSKLKHQRAAGWNMRNFKCDKENGRTGFVDSSQVIKEMPVEMLKFLRKAKIVHFPSITQKRPESTELFAKKFTTLASKMDSIVWSEDGDREVASYPRDAISLHPSAKNEVLRLCPCTEEWGIQDVLFSVDDAKPTNDDYSLFNEIILWFHSYIANTENQWWHEWQEGDFLIPDLFVMIHCAESGFSAGQREFDGFWCFPPGTSYCPEDFRYV